MTQETTHDKTPLDGPRPDAAVLHRRLDVIRQALGADNAAVARRVPDGADARFEVLAQCASSGAVRPAGQGVPLSFVTEIFRDGRTQEFGRHSPDPQRRARLVAAGITWLGGWPLPSDRWPSVAVIAWSHRRRDPGTIRRHVAESGMEALARALAPPRWMPFAPLRPPVGEGRGVPAAVPPAPDPPPDDTLAAALERVERSMILRALQASEGNKTAAARSLALSRQGLYRKLRRHGLLAAPRRSRQRPET